VLVRLAVDGDLGRYYLFYIAVCVVFELGYVTYGIQNAVGIVNMGRIVGVVCRDDVRVTAVVGIIRAFLSVDSVDVHVFVVGVNYAVTSRENRPDYFQI